MKQYEDGSWHDFEVGEVIDGKIDPGWSGPGILIVAIGDGPEVPAQGSSTANFFVRIGTLTRADFSNPVYGPGGPNEISAEDRARIEQAVKMYDGRGVRVDVGSWERA